jgi:hypothetical protein
MPVLYEGYDVPTWRYPDNIQHSSLFEHQ